MVQHVFKAIQIHNLTILILYCEISFYIVDDGSFAFKFKLIIYLHFDNYGRHCYTCNLSRNFSETARCNMPHNHNVAQHFLANAQCNIPLATFLTIFVEQPIKLCYLYIVFSLYSTSKQLHQVERNVAQCNTPSILEIRWHCIV